LPEIGQNKEREIVNKKQTYSVPTLVITINRQPFADILALLRRKCIEYRDMTEYWETRLKNVGKPPFNMRMRNGYAKNAPEATVRVTKVVRRKSKKYIELHLGRVLEVKRWDRKKERPRN